MVALRAKLLPLIVFIVTIWLFEPTTVGQAFRYITSDQTVMHRTWGSPPQITKTEEACLTQAIYYEAGNQPRQGKEAVALVILNRVNQPHYAKSICGVVHQSTRIRDRLICQFSYYCEVPSKKINAEWWKESTMIARRSLTNSFEYGTIKKIGTAKYFHASYVMPHWAKQKEFTAQIGDHLFYRDRV